MTNLVVGAHVSGDNPFEAAKALGLAAIQVFVADPQSWKSPIIPGGLTPEQFRAGAAEAGVDVFVHARYVINVATTNNKVRIPSRKMLQADMDAAASIGAKGLIVHGGHVTAEDDPMVGFANWRKAVEQLDMKVPLLLENTAGGNHAMARRLDAIKHLWDAVGDSGAGFCLDTCHAHAGGIPMGDVAETILGITGRIDLVHCNDSRDGFDSGADRHANLGNGHIDLDEIVHCLRTAAAPVILETPAEAHDADLRTLAAKLA